MADCMNLNVTNMHKTGEKKKEQKKTQTPMFHDIHVSNSYPRLKEKNLSRRPRLRVNILSEFPHCTCASVIVTLW